MSRVRRPRGRRRRQRRSPASQDPDHFRTSPAQGAAPTDVFAETWILPESEVAAASPDLLRAMVKTFADALMSAEANALCSAEYGQISKERVDHRNGYRPREQDTRADSVELAVPELRSGSYFTHRLLERRRSCGRRPGPEWRPRLISASPIGYWRRSPTTRPA
ncbi:transposase [Streptomyces sp. NPDC059837]|uniref:transposase n=1 Tax=Streptomyces sp. NPDC059837 TaxID=3346968 RepID=UPI00365FCFBA